MFDIQKLCQTLSSLGLQLQMTGDPLSKVIVVLEASCYWFFEFNLIHSLWILVSNTNSVSLKNRELANFLYVRNLDIAAISETKLAPKYRFSMPG